MSTEFEEFKEEVIAEIRANIHKYPSVCKMLLGKIDRLEAEADKAAHDRKKRFALGQFEMRDRAAKVLHEWEGECAEAIQLAACSIRVLPIVEEWGSTPPPRTYEQGAEDSRDTAFLQGYVSAVANLINLRDEPTIAAEVLAQFGSIDWSKIVEEDKEALVKGGVLRALPTQPEGVGDE